MKIDRRVAIGTMVAGLAGAPLILKALKGKYAKGIPDGAKKYDAKFKKGWAECLQQIALPSEQIEGPSSFTLRLNVPEERAYDVLVLRCDFPEGSTVESLDPAVFPIWFGRVHAQMRAKRVGRKDTFGLSAKADLYEMLAQYCDPAELLRQQGMDTSTGEYVFVPKGNCIGEVILSDGTTRAFPGGDLPPCCALLSSALWSYFPDKMRLKAGAKWEVPAGVFVEHALPCQVVGFARVAGKDTAVISCEVEQPEFRSSSACVVVVGDGKNTRIIKGTKSTDSLRMKAYLDLNTGLPVRQELRRWGQVQMPDSTVRSAPTSFVVSRILDA